MQLTVCSTTSLHHRFEYLEVITDRSFLCSLGFEKSSDGRLVTCTV